MCLKKIPKSFKLTHVKKLLLVLGPRANYLTPKAKEKSSGIFCVDIQQPILNTKYQSHEPIIPDYICVLIESLQSFAVFLASAYIVSMAC